MGDNGENRRDGGEEKTERAGADHSNEMQTNERPAEAGGQSSAPPSSFPPAGGKKPWKAGDVWKGIGLVAVLHLIWFTVPIALFFIGVAQLLYVVPALIIGRKNSALMQGILIAAGVTFLLNAACYGLVLNYS